MANEQQGAKVLSKKQLKVPIFFMEEHLSKEQIRLETEESNAKYFMENDYETARKKFDNIGSPEN